MTGRAGTVASLGARLVELARRRRERLPADLLDAEERMVVALRERSREAAVGVGERLRPFCLPDAAGELHCLTGRLVGRPLVLSFQRGGWCPFCRTELLALQRGAKRWRELGAVVVAVLPQLPGRVGSFAERFGLDLELLFDADNGYARRLGLCFSLPAELDALYRDRLGLDVRRENGSRRAELPIAATVVLDRRAVVRDAAIDPDFRRRMEPARILAALQGIGGR